MKIKEFSDRLRAINKIESILKTYPDYKKDFVFQEDPFFDEDPFYTDAILITINPKKYKKYINEKFKIELVDDRTDNLEIRFFQNIEIEKGLDLIFECYVPLFIYNGDIFRQVNKDFNYSLLNEEILDYFADVLMEHDFPLNKLPIELQNTILFRKE